MFLHKMCVLFKGYMSKQIQGPIFLGKTKRLRKDCWGYGPCKNDLKMMELFYFLELSIRVDFGTVKGVWGEFPRRKIMIGVWRTRLDGFWAQLCDTI